MMCVRVLLAAVLVLSACAGSGTIVSEDTASPDLVSDSVLRSDTVLLPTDLQTAEKFSQEIVLDLPFELPGEDTGGPSCDAGEGCFLDPCDENSDCQSGWCVEHMGDSVCTISCQEECPAGWSCQQVAGTAPDLVFVCVSDVANLCKPCATGDNCKSLGGADVVCVDYGEEGSFCGGACAADTDCPWGFSCLTTVTVDGIDTVQCVADAGVCPCTTTSVKLALFTPCENANNWGTCEGMRVCEESGLSPCDALMPTEEACNGFDDDCDGDVDEESCDDENECTQDSCAGEAGCQYVPLEGGECKDGNPCTVADLCSDGVCVGTPVTCDDDDPCTDDSCDGAGGCVFEPNEEPCDDGDPCTVGDECNGGECAGITVPCDCQEDGDCEALEDGDLCNGTLYCDLSKFPYQCRVEQGTQINCPEPVGSDKPCLAAQCDPLAGVCSEVATNDGVPCDDELPCTVADICEAGVCTGGPATNCNDGNPCTNDSCQPDIGCLNEPILAPCSDLDACTLGDECVDGTCEPGPAADCDDGNVCTDDSCDPGSGCIHTANNAACSDGNACTDGDQCLNGDCLWSSAVQCDDGNPCTDDSCDPAAGCVFGLNDSPCDDGNLCTTGDFCHLGECTSAGSLNCDDGNLCTDDSCTLDAGCTFVENNVACDDDNACTLGDTCGGGWCVAGPPLQCGDDNPCTDDSCDSEAGCLYSFNSAPCSDSEFCTVDDQCALGECVSGAPLACDDNNLCTDDECQAGVGCVFTPNEIPCNDDDACTVGDLCDGGECAGSEIDCDDDNICTDDGCNQDGDCENFANAADCPGGQCAGGVCVPDCIPDCAGKDCGDDGCAGLCGTCQQDFECVAGNCQSTLTKRVFVTSQLFNAGLGGVTGADSKCQNIANGAALGGDWKAWISQPSGSNSPSNRFAKSNSPYVLLDNTKIADDWADLTDGTLDHAIDRTEHNLPEGNNTYVWTATAINGTFNTASWGGCGSTICQNFSNGSTCLPCGGCGGFGGQAGYADKGWTDQACGCCSNEWRLYCFEQ